MGLKLKAKQSQGSRYKKDTLSILFYYSWGFSLSFLLWRNQLIASPIIEGYLAFPARHTVGDEEIPLSFPISPEISGASNPLWSAIHQIISIDQSALGTDCYQSLINRSTKRESIIHRGNAFLIAKRNIRGMVLLSPARRWDVIWNEWPLTGPAGLNSKVRSEKVLQDSFSVESMIDPLLGGMGVVKNFL